MSENFKYSICNETFAQNTPDYYHEIVCEKIARLGYTGLEIAPFTLGQLITDVPGEKRRDLKRIAESHGITILGLHWLLAKTEGFYLTSPDAELQKKTGCYFAELAKAAHDLGGHILVLGSPLQRNLLPGVSIDQADDYAIQTLSHCLKTLEQTNVTLALEPLGPVETNYMNSAADAVRLIERLQHPQVKLHLDVKAMSTEPQSIQDVIQQNQKHLVHFHANDPNRRGPGFGEVKFEPIFQALREIEYGGWISVEVFDYMPDAETIARESIQYMKSCEPKR